MSSADSSGPSYHTRLLLHHPSNSIGISGLLVLPQAFRAIYLGETFCSYISINKSSNFEVKDIIIKAEMQTERQRLVLLETLITETRSRSELRRRTRRRWSAGKGNFSWVFFRVAGSREWVEPS